MFLLEIFVDEDTLGFPGTAQIDPDTGVTVPRQIGMVDRIRTAVRSRLR